MSEAKYKVKYFYDGTERLKSFENLTEAEAFAYNCQMQFVSAQIYELIAPGTWRAM